MNRAGGDRGVGTLLTAAAALVLLTLAAGGTVLVGWLARAVAVQDAADLAALAAASAQAEGLDPCVTAAEAATRNGVLLVTCVVRAAGEAFVVEVAVSGEPRLTLPGLPAAVTRSAAAGTG